MKRSSLVTNAQRSILGQSFQTISHVFCPSAATTINWMEHDEIKGYILDNHESTEVGINAWWSPNLGVTGNGNRSNGVNAKLDRTWRESPVCISVYVCIVVSSLPHDKPKSFETTWLAYRPWRSVQGFKWRRDATKPRLITVGDKDLGRTNQE